MRTFVLNLVLRNLRDVIDENSEVRRGTEFAFRKILNFLTVYRHTLYHVGIGGVILIGINVRFTLRKVSGQSHHGVHVKAFAFTGGDGSV